MSAPAFSGPGGAPGGSGEFDSAIPIVLRK